MPYRNPLLFLGAAAASLAVLILFGPDSELGRGMAILTLVAILWLTETLNITITALLVPVLTVGSGIFDIKAAFAAFANPIIFLFLGGFALASVMQKQQLDQYLARTVLHLARGRTGLAWIYLFGLTAFLSMWISNTATTAMMIPLALGMLSNLPYERNESTYWFLLLGLAYSANIGGIGTLIGSPPNAIAAANANIAFDEWLIVGLPVVMLALPIMLLTLWLLFRPTLPKLQVDHELPASLTPQQKSTLLIFALTVLLWINGQWIGPAVGIDKGMDTVVAMLALLAVTTTGLVRWTDIERDTNWGVLLLFGGGLTLSAMMQESGASLYLANIMSTALEDAPLLLVLASITAFIVLLTEFTSNTASSALLIPVFISVCSVLDLPPVTISMLIAIGASCAFMLPVATPPNALVFGTGYIPQKSMMKSGIAMNTLMITLLSLLAWIAVTFSLFE